jgi:Mn-dependent DtxR family transcriptional regulator
MAILSLPHLYNFSIFQKLEIVDLKSEKDPNVLLVLSAISDDKGLQLLKVLSSLQTEDKNSFCLAKILNLSRKQLYDKISKLSNAGLIKRKLGSYHLTTFGVVISDSIRVIEDALRTYSNLKALDVIDISEWVTRDEIIKLIEALVHDEKVKRILKKKYYIESTAQRPRSQF